MTDDIVARLRQTHWNGCNCVGCEAADEIERLRAERDEARRGLCYEVAAWVAGFKHSTHEAESRAEAERRGWDCFKEETDGK
jgi:hypothetical protein